MPMGSTWRTYRRFILSHVCTDDIETKCPGKDGSSHRTSIPIEYTLGDIDLSRIICSPDCSSSIVVSLISVL